MAEIQKTIEYAPAGRAPVFARRVFAAGATNSPPDAGTLTSGVEAEALRVISLSTMATGTTVSLINHRPKFCSPNFCRMLNHPDGFGTGKLANVD